MLKDLETSPLPENEKALFRFIDKVNKDSPRIRQEDIDALHEYGWTDEQLYYAITVCAMFNFYNRWVDATGVRAMSEEDHRKGGKRSAASGYVRTGKGG